MPASEKETAATSVMHVSRGLRLTLALASTRTRAYGPRPIELVAVFISRQEIPLCSTALGPEPPPATTTRSSSWPSIPRNNVSLTAVHRFKMDKIDPRRHTRPPVCMNSSAVALDTLRSDTRPRTRRLSGNWQMKLIGRFNVDLDSQGVVLCGVAGLPCFI